MQREKNLVAEFIAVPCDKGGGGLKDKSQGQVWKPLNLGVLKDNCDTSFSNRVTIWDCWNYLRIQ